MDGVVVEDEAGDVLVETEAEDEDEGEEEPWMLGRSARRALRSSSERWRVAARG